MSAFRDFNFALFGFNENLLGSQGLGDFYVKYFKADFLNGELGECFRGCF